MIATKVRPLLLPLVLAATLGACASNAVQPGIVGVSAPATPAPYGSAASYGTPVGGSGRVVSIREVALQGAGGPYRRGGQGAMTGGLLGAAGGATVGAIVSNSVGGSLVGLLLGAVGGAIAGTIADGQRGAGQGIEVTVQRDDGQSVTIAQSDDGDVQLGDRVQIVQDRQGMARAVRETGRNPD